MKILSLILVTIFFTVACKESTTEPLPNVNSSDYFPNSDGSYYNYNVSVYDSSGLVQSGIKKSHYSGDTTLLLTQYQIKIDSFQLNSLQYGSKSYFRKSSSGIFYYVDVDTNGFYGIVPDSLRGAISFDLEYRSLYQPFVINQTWPVNKVLVDLLYIEFDLFKIDAEVISKDTINQAINNSTITREVFIIRYTAKLTADLNQPPTTFNANGWIAEGIGFIKWEGDSEIINFFAGRNIYMPNTTVIEELFSFKVE